MFVAKGMLLWCIETHVYAYDTIAAAAAVYYIGFGWQPTAAVPSAVSTFLDYTRACICDNKKGAMADIFQSAFASEVWCFPLFVFVVPQEGSTFAESN